MGHSCLTEIYELMCAVGGKITIMKHEQNNQYKESVYLLHNILEKYPLCVLSWINYGDSLWGLNEKSHSKIAYQKYIYTLKSQNKDLTKISQRVFERSK